jgi:hypothetical protein
MERISHGVYVGRFRAFDIEIHHDWILSASDDNSFHGLIRVRIHLLMGNVRRDINEITGPGLFDMLKSIAPTKARCSAHNVEHCFKLAVMMSGGSRSGLHNYSACPQLSGACSRVRNGGGPGHPRSLRRIAVKLTVSHDPYSVLFPIGHKVRPGHAVGGVQ